MTKTFLSFVVDMFISQNIAFCRLMMLRELWWAQLTEKLASITNLFCDKNVKIDTKS